MSYSSEMFYNQRVSECSDSELSHNYRLDSWGKKVSKDDFAVGNYEARETENERYERLLVEAKLFAEEKMLEQIDLVSMQKEVEERYDYYEVGYPSERESMKWTCIKKCKDRKEADRVFRKLYPKFKSDPSPVLHIRPFFNQYKVA
jgi:hypothetical protein